MKKALTGYLLEELKREFQNQQRPGFRAVQVFDWLYGQGAKDWIAMTNIGRTLQTTLAEQYVLREAVLDSQRQTADGTIKFLLRWPDDALTETVLMPGANRNAVCISSQIGCPVQCTFCASGLHGLERSLSAGEMVEQVLWAQELLGTHQRISHVVIMGMGEPLVNYDNTLKAVAILNADWGCNIGARHITISTVGLPEQIRKLAHEPYQVTLAVSLHAPNDKLRSELIPWAKNIPLTELFHAIEDYYDSTHREITLEYLLLDGINCSVKHAEELSHWVHQSRCNVNLIAYNPVEGKTFKAPGQTAVNHFIELLKQRGVNVHLRHSRGLEIDAACGQLRRRHKT